MVDVLREVSTILITVRGGRGYYIRSSTFCCQSPHRQPGVPVTLDAVFLYASLVFLKVLQRKRIFSFIGCQKNFTRTYYYHLNVHYFEGFGKYVKTDAKKIDWLKILP